MGKSYKGRHRLDPGLRCDRLYVELSDKGNVARYRTHEDLRTSWPLVILPTVRQGMEIPEVTNNAWAQPSPLGGSGRPESRPVNMPIPCAENSCGPQTRVGKTHQTHHTHPAIPDKPLQTHLMKLSWNQSHIMSLVSLVSFIPLHLHRPRNNHHG